MIKLSNLRPKRVTDSNSAPTKLCETTLKKAKRNFSNELWLIIVVKCLLTIKLLIIDVIDIRITKFLILVMAL